MGNASVIRYDGRPMSTTLSTPSTLPTRTSAASQARAELARSEARHDNGLVQRFLGGDETAFIEIMSRYQSRMFAIAYATLKNRADAEEIAQDTFIRAHRGLARFRGDGSLAGWLHRIALNLARNRYWYFFRRQRHTTLSLDSQLHETPDGTFADLLATDEPGPRREALTREFAALVTLCRKRLSEPARRVLTMRNDQHQPYAVIARELDVSVGTVKSRLARARNQLRVLVAATCPEFHAGTPLAAWFDPARSAASGVIRCA